ncbi:helix-turn-helix domain-containing protein [Lentzea sp. NEAU-D13]|uniref:Helix-turn-helix domain-containing protein n=1 Tax=Lentzea alba TaxID=2714351 RepID=A0A7C9RQD9_9PSEU|nr:helix-turn-helix transcriptional regulator [Lentzea alba]NGY60851.1 helix-turn-helix domain-containing protein [Lentzea alba]
MGKKRLKPMADVDSPAAVVAIYLRAIYADATELSLVQLAARTRYSQASLSEALSGRTVPTLELITAFVRECGREDALVEAEHVWRRETARSRGSTRPPHPDLVETWDDLHRELVLLVHQSGLFTPKALCDAANAAGHPIKPTSAHRWLTDPRPLRSDSLHTILNACRVSMRSREPWVRAFDRASGSRRSPQQQSVGLPVATSGPEALFSDLRRLSRGRGVHASNVDTQVGPVLLQLCDLTALDGPETIRQKISDWVQTTTQQLPHHLRLAVTTPLGLNPEAQFRFLQERIDWLATEQDRSPGTCRRRIDEAMTRLVEAAFTPLERQNTMLVSRDHTWHLREVETILNLDGDTPRCTESRTIIARRDGLDRITWGLTLPRRDDGTPANLDVTVLHGAQLLSKEQRSPRRTLIHLGLPRRLRAGELHDFVLQVSLPHGQPMSPQFVLWPERPCERFQLVARFGEQTMPSDVWRVDHVFHRNADEIDSGHDRLAVNSFGEVLVSFTDLQTGYGYGIRWEC